MPNVIQFWIEAAATAAAIIVIPLYMGFIHVSVSAAVAYAGVGGLAMALGEGLQFGRGFLAVAIVDVILWSGVILCAGGLIYGLALLLI